MNCYFISFYRLITFLRVCVYCVSSIHSPISGHGGFDYFLAIMTNAAANFHIWAFVWTYAFISLGIQVRVELLGYLNSVFNFLRDC